MSTLDDNLLHESGSILEINSRTSEYLAEIRKWAKFLSIIGFGFVGLMLLVGIFMSVSMSSADLGLPFASGVLGIIYLILAGIYFFPVIYLFRFSQEMKLALNANSTDSLEEAFMNLKSHYRFIGIMTIVIFALYLVGIAVLITAGASAFSTL